MAKKPNQNEASYVGPIVTVDTVCLRAAFGRLEVLVIERTNAPYARHSALPGVYMALGETILEASDRCLATKAAEVLPVVPQEAYRPTIGVYDGLGRDLRGHSISLVTAAFVPFQAGGAEVASKANQWLDVARLRKLAFDHNAIVTNAQAWAASHLWTQREIFAALLGTNTASTGAIADVVAAVEGVAVDASNLRRKIIASGLFTATPDTEAKGRGRPGIVWQLNAA